MINKEEKEDEEEEELHVIVIRDLLCANENGRC